MFILLGETPSPAILPAIPGPVQALPASRVANTLAPPYRFICRIVTRSYDKPGFSVGTGVLISPFHVLTCAHVIYPPEAPRTREIDVHPAQNGPDEDSLRFRANGWAISPSWRLNDCRTAPEDYGIIRLAKSTRQAFIPLRAFDPAILSGTVVHLAGYPATSLEPTARYMYESHGPVTGVIRIDRCDARTADGRIFPLTSAAAGLIAHQLDSAPSQSGGAMWINEGGTQTLIGTHAGIIGGTRKKAVLLADTVRNRLHDWMRNSLPPIQSVKAGTTR
jgi:V8-like Glu-specific endopeptidase